MSNLAWDAQLAARIVRPLCNSWVTPNHLTTLRLLTGVGAIFLFGEGEWLNLAAWLWVLSVFLDHADGELARMSGKHSPLGHLYDLAVDALVTIGVFIGIGWGLTYSVPDAEGGPLFMGLVTGVAVATIFHLRHKIEHGLGKAVTKQPAFAGFEPEDTLYLLPLITWLDDLRVFLLVATLITPLMAILVARLYFAQLRKVDF
jgi:archaetidylinositol phosphate synthase